MRRLSQLLFVIGLLFTYSAALAASVHDNYTAPRFAVPYISTPPRIDGIIDDAVWNHALSIDALQTSDGGISTRRTRFWICWDADHLYIAMRSPIRPGERMVQANRQVGRDNSKAVFDDAYELFIDAHTHSPDGEPVYFQYLGNVAGAKYDVMFEPAVGNSRPGWESGWHPANRITPDGRFWEMELAIPRQSIYQQSPFTDGMVLGGLLVRDFKRPWEQNNSSGIGSFSAPDSFSKFMLSKTAPAIHLLAVADPQAATLGLALAAARGGGGPPQILNWAFDSDGGVHQSGQLNLQSSGLATADPGLGLDHPGPGYYRNRVASADGQTTYLDWVCRRAFGDKTPLTAAVHDDGKDATLDLVFNPVYNFVRVTGDFINYDQRAQIARFVASIADSTGKILVQQPMAMDSLAYVNGLLRLGDCPPGSYHTSLVGYDSAGKEVFRKQTPFEKKDLAKDFPWWNTNIGRIDRVIAPWTPVKTDGPRIDVWGRSMTVGAAGLPSQVTTQGMDLLAGPATLTGESNGQQVEMSHSDRNLQSSADYRAVVTTNGTLGGAINVSSIVTTEFDGLYKVEMTLAPRREPVPLTRLKIVIPLKPECADYFNACGEGIRYGFSYGYLPKQKLGPLWDSKQVDGQPMLVGSFIPYVWVGNAKGGLCWMADGDQGWSPSNTTPAIEIRRDSPERVDLVFNLISDPTSLDHPRTITFALQATPVKATRAGWRMDTWSTGDSFQDFCQLYPRGKDLIWNAIPFTLDPAACKKLVDRAHASSTGYLFGFDSPKYHLNAVPYFENNQIDPTLAPASAYFADQWHARVSDSLCFDRSLTNFIVYSLDNWTKQDNIDGWYIDNVRPVACDNIDAGRGYRLPDGRIQPTYQMFATRQHLLRIRAMFQDNGKSGKFVLHMTNHMIMPWIGAADLALDGEDHVTFPDMHKDFIDFWSAARMRLDDQQPQGTPVTFLQEYQGNWQSADLDRVMRAYTAMTILNDVLPGANPNGHNHPVWAGRERFGIDAHDVTFVPYWNTDNGVSVDSRTGGEFLASSWRRPGRVLIAVVNRGPCSATATLRLDAAKLGVAPGALGRAIDADTGQPIPTASAEPGTLALPVDRHDYRQLLIGVAQPNTP
jgi:hypothetical protein